jgi:ketosteroid isomerase-like protein
MALNRKKSSTLRVYGNAMTSKLPAVVTAYLAADKAQDLDKLCQCFTNDALVHDESRQYQGHDSIRTWKKQSAAKYDYTVEPIDVAVTERNIKLHARLTGNFPGSPAELRYTFVLANGKIQSLAIH